MELCKCQLDCGPVIQNVGYETILWLLKVLLVITTTYIVLIFWYITAG